MEPTASELVTPLEGLVFYDVHLAMDYATERDERIRAAGALVWGPLLGTASWLILGAAAHAVFKFVF